VCGAKRLLLLHTTHRTALANPVPVACQGRLAHEASAKKSVVTRGVARRQELLAARRKAPPRRRAPAAHRTAARPRAWQEGLARGEKARRAVVRR